MWTLISEIFPLDVRGQALAIAVVSNFVANGILSLCAASDQSSIDAAQAAKSDDEDEEAPASSSALLEDEWK